MKTRILYGKPVAEKIIRKLARTVDEITKQNIRPPGLGIIHAGFDPASRIYIKNKQQVAQASGFYVEILEPDNENQLFDAIEYMNRSSQIDGFIVQLPLPPLWNIDAVLEKIEPSKDADGFHPLNSGRIMAGQNGILPATPAGILSLLAYYGISTSGKHVVIAGRSRIVGRPLSVWLSANHPQGNATVTLIHSRTLNPENYIRQADIFVSAVGKPHIWKLKHFKPGAVVVDVGINRCGERLCGDVDSEGLEGFVSAITPVPGGVGPMTVASLIRNVWLLYKRYFLATPGFFNNGKTGV